MKATVSKYVHYLAIGVVALLGVAAFCPLPAFAAEEGQGIGAILPHMDEFIPMLVAFIILWIILCQVRLAAVRRHAEEARRHHQEFPGEV